MLLRLDSVEKPYSVIHLSSPKVLHKAIPAWVGMDQYTIKSAGVGSNGSISPGCLDFTVIQPVMHV